MRKTDHFFSEASQAFRKSPDDAPQIVKKLFQTHCGNFGQFVWDYWEETVLPREKEEDAIMWLQDIIFLYNGELEDENSISDGDWDFLKIATEKHADSLPLSSLTCLMAEILNRGKL
ncbi:MAG: hypothetical protein IIW10_01630 [Spirochaetaceae bacterium]|nr:hypothetical protein [Spirochaetaceae bacterium]